jgi:uncharacterized protein (DUF2236 family)
VGRSTGGLFGPDAAIRKVNGEAVLLVGGGRALLMQLAHPLVARGVAEHSGFQANPFARLQRTLAAVYAIVFGTEEQARRAAGTVRAVHDRVRGPGYEANDPRLLLWVHATLVDTALRVYNRFIGTLSPSEAEQYYVESTLVAEVLGVPVGIQPSNLAEFRAYVRTMVGTLEVGNDARRLAGQVLHPKLPWALAPMVEPAAVLARQVTVGLLPPPLRQGYHLSWDQGRQALLLAAGVSARTVLPRLPAMARRVTAG